MGIAIDSYKIETVLKATHFDCYRSTVFIFLVVDEDFAKDYLSTFSIYAFIHLLYQVITILLALSESSESCPEDSLAGSTSLSAFF